MEWNSLNTNAKSLDVVIFIIGCVVSFFVSAPWYVCGMVAINIYNALMSALGVIPMIAFFFK